MLSAFGIICFGGIFTLCVLLVLIILLSFRRSQLCVDDEQAVEVFKIVEALREICPVGLSQGWSLIGNHCSLRCWQKVFPFKFLGSTLSVYGTSTTLNVSTVSVLNVIADVTTWPEWDPEIHYHPLQAEISEDPELHGDCYMQCDQLVSMTISTCQKPGILMHRFGNLEQNGVGWIFLWHLSHLNWCLFLAQPLETSGGVELSHCLLTMISGKNPHTTPKENVALELATKLRNLKDAISRSRVQIRPFILGSSVSNLNNPHLPTIQSALSDLPSTPCVLLRPSQNLLKSKLQSDNKDSKLLAIVPFAMSKPITLFNVRGFVLITKKPSIKLGEKNQIEQLEKEKVRKRHKSQTRNLGQESESKEEAKKRDSVSCTETNKSVMPTVTITRPDDEISEPGKRTPTTDHRRLSDSLLLDKNRDHMDSDKLSIWQKQFRKRSKSAERIIRNSEEKEICSDQESGPNILGNLFARARKLSRSTGNISSTSNLLEGLNKETVKNKKSQKERKRKNSDILKKVSNVKNNFASTETSDPDIIKLPVLLTGKLQDFKQLGANCISELLSEVNSAFETAIHVPDDEPKNVPGKWIYCNSPKKLTLMMKLQDTTAQQTVSYISHGTINASSSAIRDAVCNPLSRFIFDETVKKINILQNISKEQKIVHTYHEVTTLMKKEKQDFCILLTIQQVNSKLILAYQSIESNLCPLHDDVIRGIIRPSGWIIKVTKENKQCSVTLLEQLVISEPESLFIEEMASIQSQCIPSLKKYLTTKPF